MSAPTKVLTPGSGWVHISTPEAIQAAPFPYHISVCAPWQATPQEFAALRNEVDGKDVVIPVERVTRGYCAVVTNIFGPVFADLHSRGWHSTVTVSM